MRAIRAEASGVIGATPQHVYAILADYRAGHPRILPEEHFPELVVEHGGSGGGTVLRVRLRAMGAEKTYHMVVREPEPGRVLVEADETAGVVTTFAVAPVDGGQRSLVRIVKEWRHSGGLLGLAERLLNPPVARRIYRKELRLLIAEARASSSEAPRGSGG